MASDKQSRTQTYRAVKGVRRGIVLKAGLAAPTGRLSRLWTRHL